MESKRHRVKPAATQRARRLRHDVTIPEKLVWGRLRAAQLGGWKFRRQAPIGRNIVDFYCAKASLVIELDGLSHDDTGAYDAMRTNALTEMGLGVLRYTNDDVLSDLDAIMESIFRQLSS